MFAVGHAASGPWTAETEALLAVRAGLAISHRSALVLWDLGRPAPPGAPVEVSVGLSGAGDPAGIRLHRTAPDQRDLRIRQGLPVTSPSLTLMQCAPILEPRPFERAFEEAARRGWTSLGELRSLLDRPLGSRAARRRVRELLEAYTTSTFTRSQAEELFLSLIRQADLPQPLVNATRHGYELDFFWPEHGVAVEVDGFAFHSARLPFESDSVKWQKLGAHGILVTRVTWRQLTEEPVAVMVRLAQTLTATGSATGLRGVGDEQTGLRSDPPPV